MALNRTNCATVHVGKKERKKKRKKKERKNKEKEKKPRKAAIYSDK